VDAAVSDDDWTTIHGLAIIGAMTKVGIKLADGKFYPILDENSSVAKKLVLTTVRDGQTSAQIDFYRDDESVDDIQYIGTLVVNDFMQRYAGETSIVLRVRAAGNGLILAEAEEADGTGGTQTLEIDLNALDTENLEKEGLGLDEKRESGVVAVKKRRLSPIVPIVIAAVLFLAAAGIFLFLFLSQGFPRSANIYAETQFREEPANAPPVPIGNEAAKTPGAPPPDQMSQTDGYSREIFQTKTNAPDTSRKALRTETVR
jgi:hypothetical protein